MPNTDQRYPPIPWTLKPLRAIIRFLMTTLSRLHVEGIENVPAEGPLIFVSNHLHHLDTPALGITLPRWGTRPLAGEKYERHIFSPILRAAGAIFIRRGEVDRTALRQAFNVLEDGYCLAVAVEGTRSKTGALAEGKTGAAYLATRSGAPLVPVVVWGTENIIPSWFRLKRADVYVRYGQPFRLPEGRARTAQLDAYTDEIMTTLASLLPESYRGVYSDHPLLQDKLVVQSSNG